MCLYWIHFDVIIWLSVATPLIVLALQLSFPYVCIKATSDREVVPKGHYSIVLDGTGDMRTLKTVLIFSGSVQIWKFVKFTVNIAVIGNCQHRIIIYLITRCAMNMLIALNSEWMADLVPICSF